MTDPLSQVFAALADPTRRDLVARLTDGDATVGQLAAPYQVSVQAISKHLKVLEQAGLVSRQAEARRSPVHLEAQVFDLMTKWIERYRQQAEARYRGWTRCWPYGRRDGPSPDPGADRMNDTITTTSIEADPTVPIIRIIRDFLATPGPVVPRAHRPELFARWVGPDGMTTTVDRWDASTGGSWRYVAARDGMEFGFPAASTRSGRTASCRPSPGRALRTKSRSRCSFEDLGDGRTRLYTQSLCDSFAARDAVLAAV